ncbi:hypothetical protein Hanom_Chr03g00215351 [Helianthus anomalus]
MNRFVGGRLTPVGYDELGVMLSPFGSSEVCTMVYHIRGVFCGCGLVGLCRCDELDVMFSLFGALAVCTFVYHKPFGFFL